LKIKKFRTDKTKTISFSTGPNDEDEDSLLSAVSFVSKALNKLDHWILGNVREIIIKNSVRYVTVDPNAHIYLLLLYMFCFI